MRIFKVCLRGNKVVEKRTPHMYYGTSKELFFETFFKWHRRSAMATEVGGRFLNPLKLRIERGCRRRRWAPRKEMNEGCCTVLQYIFCTTEENPETLLLPQCCQKMGELCRCANLFLIDELTSCQDHLYFYQIPFKCGFSFALNKPKNPHYV